MGTYEDGSNRILTIVGMYLYSSLSEKSFESFAEKDDETSASERHWRRMSAREHEQQVAYLKGLVTGAWNWVASAFPPMPSDPVVSIASQRLDSNLITPKDLRPGSAVLVSTGVTDIPKMSRLVHREQTAEVGDPGER